jgi:hypothetical protein
MKQCGSCGSKTIVSIERRVCDDCPENGVWDPDLCVYWYPEQDRREVLPDRTQAGEEHDCRLGSNWNAGCTIRRCVECGWHDFVPKVVER